jgi:heme-degrading monooxygenase HmoA
MTARVARIWHGRVPTARADAYLDLMHELALPDYRSIPGNLAALALRRDDADGTTHVLMLTLWESFDEVRAFAGPAPETAKYYDFDADFLLEMEPTVSHYDVVASAPGSVRD